MNIMSRDKKEINSNTHYKTSKVILRSENTKNVPTIQLTVWEAKGWDQAEDPVDTLKEVM